MLPLVQVPAPATVRVALPVRMPLESASVVVLAAAVKLAVPPLILVAVGLYDPATLTVPELNLTVPAPLTEEAALRLKVPPLKSRVAVAVKLPLLLPPLPRRSVPVRASTAPLLVRA